MKTKVSLTFTLKRCAIVDTNKFSRRLVLSINEYRCADNCKQSEYQGVHLGAALALNNVICCLH